MENHKHRKGKRKIRKLYQLCDMIISLRQIEADMKSTCGKKRLLYLIKML